MPSNDKMTPSTAPNLDFVLPLLENFSEASLGTVEENRPFVSGTGFIFVKNADTKTATPSLTGGKIFILLSDLSRHTRNLKKNPAASLLIMEPDSTVPVHEKKRLSLQGKVRAVENHEKFETLKSRYLKIFPRAEIFFTLPDFRFYELETEQIHWIGGFGKALTWP